MQSECNIQPFGVGSSSEEVPALAHKFKLSKCTAKPGNRLYMPWKYVLDENNKLVPFRCPTCGEEIRNLPDKTDDQAWHYAGVGCGISSNGNCGSCGWNPSMLTTKQRAQLRTDPEMIPAKRYMERLEFNDNKNRINGKSKRTRKAISRACY